MKLFERMRATSSAKSTKRALIASAACTLLCGFLLFSTSVAWFSATRESSVNEIYSGNLDVKLSYFREMDIGTAANVDLTAWEWKEVKDTTDDIFNVKKEGTSGEQNMLWEPGAVSVVYLKVENMGTLAAKYDFTLAIDSETKGTNFAGEEFSLSDYIYGGIVDLTPTPSAEPSQTPAQQPKAFAPTDEGRAAALLAVDAPKTLAEINGTGEDAAEAMLSGVMDGSEEHPDEKVFALVLYMPDDEATGEKTNYRTPENDGDRPNVKLKLRLVATQTVGETDGFSDQYDSDVPMPDAAAPDDEVPPVKALHPGKAVITVEQKGSQSVTEAIREAIDKAKDGDIILLPATKYDGLSVPGTDKVLVFRGRGTDDGGDVTAILGELGEENTALPDGTVFENCLINVRSKLFRGFPNSGKLEFRYCKVDGELTAGDSVTFDHCRLLGEAQCVSVFRETLEDDLCAVFSDCQFTLNGEDGSCVVLRAPDEYSGHEVRLEMERCTDPDGKTDRLFRVSAVAEAPLQGTVVIDGEVKYAAPSEN